MLPSKNRQDSVSASAAVFPFHGEIFGLKSVDVEFDPQSAVAVLDDSLAETSVVVVDLMNDDFLGRRFSFGRRDFQQTVFSEHRLNLVQLAVGRNSVSPSKRLDDFSECVGFVCGHHELAVAAPERDGQLVGVEAIGAQLDFKDVGVISDEL